MNIRTSLSISLCFTEKEDIEIIKDVYANCELSHKDIYMLGIKQLASNNLKIEYK